MLSLTRDFLIMLSLCLYNDLYALASEELKLMAASFLFIGLNPRDCKSPSARNLGPVTTLDCENLGHFKFSFRNSFFGISYLIFIFKAISRISQILCTADPLLCVTWLEDFKNLA